MCMYVCTLLCMYVCAYVYVCVCVGSSVNAPNLHVVCAYLINIQDLSFLFQSETPRTSTSYTVCTGHTHFPSCTLHFV